MNLGRNHRHLEDLASAVGLPLSAVTRYAKGSNPIAWMQRLWNAVTGSGNLADRMRRSEIPAALLRTLEQLGSGAAESPEERRTGGGRGRPSASEVPPLPAPLGGGRRSPPGSPPPSIPGGRSPVPGGDSSLPPGGFNRSPFNPNFAPPLPGESTPYSEEIFCGEQSSNVFSFSYDYQASTLFVTYWGHQIRSSGVRKGRVRRGRGRSRPQLIGESGKTVGGGRGGRGSMYAYYDVPVRVFERMRSASSKGKFVWDELRVRGTVYGHKYRYSLVQGQVSTQRGVGGVYIPRKATSQGFKTRSIADLGNGRRGFQTSTLPAQEGFRTRSIGGRG